MQVLTIWPEFCNFAKRLFYKKTHFNSIFTMKKSNQTHTHTHTHTHTLVLVFTTARTDYVVPIQGVSQQELTRLVVPLAAGTPAVSPHLHGPLSALGTLLWLARPMRWERYGLEWQHQNIRHGHLAINSPPLCLVISRCLACVHNQCQTLVSVLASKRQITQVFTLPSGVWFTSMARLATKQKL